MDEASFLPSFSVCFDVENSLFALKFVMDLDGLVFRLVYV